MFYVSAYFEAHRDEYYERLLAVSRDGDWTGWSRFFLEALRVQANTNEQKARAILDLYDRLKARALGLTRPQYGILAPDWIFRQPVFRSTQFIAAAEIPEPTARRLLRVFRDGEILEEARPASGRRPALLAFRALLDIAEGTETP